MRLVDPAGFASAALLFDLPLGPGEEREIAVALPVDGTPVAPTRPASPRRRRARSRTGAAPGPRAHQRPGRGRRVARTLRTALGHILVNRSAAAPAAGSARLRPLLDPRRRADVVGAAAPRPRRRRARLPALVRVVPVRERQGAVLRDRTRRRPGARARQRRRVRLRGRRPLAVHARRRAGALPCGRTCAVRSSTWTRCGRSERTPANLAARSPRLLRPDAAVDQPRGLLRQARLLVLGRLLGRRSAIAAPLELAQALGLADDAARIAAQRDEFLPTCSRRSPRARSCTGSTCCRARPTAATSTRPRARSP